jgi:hypothetical protein
MYEGDENRIEAAEQLAAHNRHGAAEAFSAIACDAAVGDEVRLSAAKLLAILKTQRLSGSNPGLGWPGDRRSDNPHAGERREHRPQRASTDRSAHV